jgi:hypothetical protein
MAVIYGASLGASLAQRPKEPDVTVMHLSELDSN